MAGLLNQLLMDFAALGALGNLAPPFRRVNREDEDAAQLGNAAVAPSLDALGVGVGQLSRREVARSAPT